MKKQLRKKTLVLLSLALLPLASCKKEVKPFEGKALKAGKIGVEYNDNIANGTFDMYYDLDYDSSLPEGLILYDDGSIKGTPKEAGDFTFKAVMIDTEDIEYYADFTLSIEPGELIYSSFGLPDGKVGEPYLTQLGTATGIPGIKYSLKEEDALPKGLTMDKNGKLSGIPEEEAKEQSFTVVASAKGASDKEATFVLTIQPGEKKEENLGHIVFEDFDLPNGIVGETYQQSIRKAYGVSNISYAFRFSSGSGLPAGLTADKNLGIISGTPTDSTEGTIRFRVIASAPGAESVTAYVTMRIDDVYINTTRFETEYVDSVPHLSGAGYSSSPSGKGMIQTLPNASNQHVLGYLNKPTTITFKIQSEKETGAKLALGLGSENGDFDYSNSKFAIRVNSVDVDYGTIHVKQIGASESDFKCENHPISPEIRLKAGENLISFEIKQSNEATGTFTAVGCLFDYIDITDTDGNVGWRPRIANI